MYRISKIMCITTTLCGVILLPPLYKKSLQKEREIPFAIKISLFMDYELLIKPTLASIQKNHKLKHQRMRHYTTHHQATFYHIYLFSFLKQHLTMRNITSLFNLFQTYVFEQQSAFICMAKT